MKNIIEICKDFDIEIPAEKHADFLKAVSGGYRTVSDYEKQVEKMNAAVKRAETAEETLKGFEGKDFETITRERDEWKRKHDENQQKYQQEQEEREFNAVLEAAITDAKGRSPKAIMALLDMEKLRGSKNQEKDIKAALDSMRTESAYLFEDNGGNPHFTDPKGNGGGSGNPTTLKDIMKIKDPVERQRMIGQNLNLFGKGE